MNDLPSSAIGGGSTNSQAPNHKQVAGSISQPSGGVHGKELEGALSASNEFPLQDVGVEMELPKEVAAVGVSQHPTTVVIPQPVQQLGVKHTGSQTPVASGATVTLPLTQDQITQGLHQGVMSSWRWLAEWCVRRLKKLHESITK